MTDDNQNTNQQGDATTPPGTTPPHDSVDWEARYKSLQSVQEKKRQQLEQQITNLTEEREKAALEVGEKKQALETFEKQQAQYLKEKSDLEAQLKQTNEELAKTNQKVLFQKVILAEFPDLAIMVDHIPFADTEEGIRANAQAFQEKLKKYVSEGVKETLKGASSNPSGTGNTMPTGNEEDILWKRIYNSAGIIGKEEEYAKANKELQDLLARKNKS